MNVEPEANDRESVGTSPDNLNDPAPLFVPAVFHRINGLLSIVLGYTSHVLNTEELSTEAAIALKKSAEAAQRGRTLTGDVLAMLKSGAHENPLQSLIAQTDAAPGDEQIANDDPVCPQDAIISSLEPCTIWIVDDDPVFREMCATILSQEGHQVIQMPDGRLFQTKWTVEPIKPDLILCDFSMPDLNGVEMTIWLRKTGSVCPVILVSGLLGEQPDMQRVLAQRAVYYLRKPFSHSELVAAVALALGARLLPENE